MDPITTIVNIGVAGGIIALAYILYKNIRNSDKQLKFLKKQTDLFLSERQPDIQIKKYSFEGNKLNLTLYNPDSGEACDIAVSSLFNIDKPLSWSKGWFSNAQLTIPVLSETRTRKYILKTDDYGDITLNLKTADKNILTPGVLVVFPNNDEGSNSLPPGFTRDFRCEPFFYLRTKKERFWKSPDYGAKAISFGELRTLLLDNKIEEISAVFSLLSKNKLQHVKIHGTISHLVIMLSTDETLETAYKRNKRDSYTLDQNEREPRIKWEDYDRYVHGNYLESDEDE
jgi:hypothetical protein